MIRETPGVGESNTSTQNVDEGLHAEHAQSRPGIESATETLFVPPPNLIEMEGKSITPEMLTLIALDQQQIDAIVQSVPGGAKNVQDIYPLSPLQEGILFHHLMNEEIDTYVLSILFQLESRTRLSPLIAAIQQVINRHDVLRSAILWEKLARPIQIIYREARLVVEEIALDPKRGAIEQLKERMRSDSRKRDLRKAPLVWLQVAADPHGTHCYALLRVHHLICDHQSLRIVVAEITSCLQGLVDVLPAPMPFRNYVAQALEKVRTDDAEEFFRGKLRDIDEPTAPFAVFEVHGDGSQVEEAEEEIGSHLAVRIRTQARRSGVSPARFFHAAWGLVVGRMSGRDDVVYGTVLLAARQRSSRAERMLGLSVNTLPLRLRLRGSAEELLQQTHSELVELLNHDSAPLSLAQRCSGITGTAPLFTAILNYRHSAPESESESANASGVQVLARGEARTNYPLTVTIDDLGEGFRLMAKADRQIGAQRTIDYLCTVLRSLSEASEVAPQTPALALAILPERERHQVIERFNATRVQPPEKSLIHELFERQVDRSPSEVAVAYEEHSLTYAELNGKANQLARYLQTRGVGPGQLVALCVERSVEMLVGLLGILKAGAAYVPLDPSNPVGRLEYVLTDAAPRVVVTQERLKKTLPVTDVGVITLDEDWREIATHSEQNLSPRSLRINAQQLAYVIYTSGTTGKPKGVMVEHRSIVNYALHALRHFDVPSGDGSLVCTSLSFDLMLTGLYPTLLCGRTVRLCREQHGLPTLADDILKSRSLAPLKLTPSHLALLDQPLRRGQLDGCVRALVLGGEQLLASAVQAWRAYAPATRIFNHYGPTETTVGCVIDEIGEILSSTVPLGRPISNTQVYILDNYQQPVPIGVAGEIFVGGMGVARGYLGRPSLTAERFVPDSFSTIPGARMYRTGDLGRWLIDGRIEYLGRNDSQVKIRGFRIELGEVQSQLVRFAGVKEAVVTALEDTPGQKRLVAYVVPNESSTLLSVEKLRAHTRAQLPEYMVPSAFVVLNSLPLTPNGKLDRRALPAPSLEAPVNSAYEAPQGEVEEVLAGIWQTLLHTERVGRNDNFFQLGGHSLLIVQMMERLRRIGLSAEIRLVFEKPTLAELAGVLTGEATQQFETPPNLIPAACDAIMPQMLTLLELNEKQIEIVTQAVPGGAANIQDIYPLAPLQEGILFQHLFSEHRGDVYVRSTVLSVSSRDRLDQLTRALQAVIDRHDVLRTAVLWEQLPQPVQVVYRKATLPVKEIALEGGGNSAEKIQEWLAGEVQRLDLRQAPLMRLQILASASDGHLYVLLQSHHITSDFVSEEILTSEVVAHLSGAAQSIAEAMPYRNHVAQALAYARSRDSEAFFREKLGDIEQPTAPFGLMDIHGDGSQSDEHHRDVEPLLALRVYRQARRFGVSAATLFHAAWGLVVAHTSGQDDVVFGTVLLGRLHGSAGAQRIIGMFINTLPFRVKLSGVTAKELLEQVQRELVDLLHHEQASLAVAHRCSNIAGSAPVFTALLNYRHSVPNPESKWSSADGVRVLGIQVRTHYPIVLSVDDLGDGFRLSAHTDRRVDAHRMTECLHTAMQVLVDALDSMPQTAILALSVLPKRERHQLIEEFNATQVPYPRTKLIHEIFEEQVQTAPEAVAVVYEGQSLTYAKLNRRANQLARYLRDNGVGPDQLVAICLERSLDMVIGVLGILKSGGAYVPLDPSYPNERLVSMLQDATPKVVLTQQRLRSGLPDVPGVIIALDSDWNEIVKQDSTNPDPKAIGLRSSHLAYVIYTSGSTGRPKGVMIDHRSVVNLWQGLERIYSRKASISRIALNASFNFDASVQQLVHLLSGRTLFVVSQESRRDISLLRSFIERHQIEEIDCTPSQLKSWVSEALLQNNETSLRLLLVGGEAIDVDLWKDLAQRSAIHCFNVYGPTECTVDATAAYLDGDSPHIGSPMANRCVYVLDCYGQPVPIGGIGEIYIGGEGVARGYLGRPALTAERFLPDPFSVDPKARMYRTGDLGRWRAGGTIECLGRTDHQVKIRGHRIELGEIEAQLVRCDQVKEAVVIAKESVSGGKRLVAYITKRGDMDLTSKKLRMQLRAVLPDYMLPSAFVVLESLPLTPNGKLDRRALPLAEHGDQARSECDPPQGAVEEGLAGIWRELLQLTDIGRHDNFFDLGGHSLLVLKALFSINQAFGCGLSVRDVYNSPTLRELAARICGGGIEDDVVDLAREAALDHKIVARPGRSRVPAQAVMLTGATGFVGRFLLAQLLKDTDATIFCLVRAASRDDADFRLRTILARWDLWRDEFESRIVGIPGDLRRRHVGIDDPTYKMLSQNVDTIFHCATSMNHLETYAAAKRTNVDSARELLQLATTGATKTINYISTLSIFSAAADGMTRVVDELSRIDSERHPISRGYVASKWVAEKIFMIAAQRGIPCNIFRVGLVWADAEKGRYDELQREYRLFKSCLLSGYGIRNYSPGMAPTPVDYVARSVVFLANSHSDGQEVFHISSTRPTSGDLFERCNEVASTSLELMSLYNWTQEMKRLHRNGWSLPVVPLIESTFAMDEQEFYRYQQGRQTSSVHFDCKRTHRELERAGIEAPDLTDDLLKVFVEAMLSRDMELQESTESGRVPMHMRRGEITQGAPYKAAELGEPS